MKRGPYRRKADDMKIMDILKTLAIFLVFAVSPPAAYSQEKTEKRLTGLEVRVVKVEKRVSRLENGRIPGTVPEKMPENPIAAVFIKKDKIVSGKKVAVKLFVELENITNRRFEAFSGKILFMDGAGELLYEQEYARNKLFEGREKITLAISVSAAGSRMKAYLRLLKAPVITADFSEQKFY